MIYALERDVVPISPDKNISPGNVQLRPDKRPRPIVLRVNEGDCLQVTFKNMLTPTQADVEHKNFTNQPDKQPVTEFPVRLRQNDTTRTRTASMHVNGLDYVNGADADDGGNVGVNDQLARGRGRDQSLHVVRREAGPVPSLLDGRARRQRGRQRSGRPRALRLGQRRAEGSALVSLAGHREGPHPRDQGQEPERHAHHQLRGDVRGRPSVGGLPRPQHALRQRDHLHRPQRPHRRLQGGVRPAGAAVGDVRPRVPRVLRPLPRRAEGRAGVLEGGREDGRPASRRSTRRSSTACATASPSTTAPRGSAPSSSPTA